MPSSVAWKDRIVKKEYQNWLAVGHSLLLMCDGVRPYVEREMKAFHAHLLATLTSLPPCTCLTIPKHASGCAWATQLKRYHRRGTPSWKQSDRSKWCDPTVGYWEVAKLYMSDLGSHAASVVDASSTDTTGLCNLMYWCTFFKVPHALVDAVRQTRNAKWGHAANQELSDVEKADAIRTMKDLLKDPELAGDPRATNALAEIGQLELHFDLQSIEHGVLLEALRTCDSLTAELREVKDRVARVEKESRLISRRSKNNLKKAESLHARLAKMKRSKKELNRRLRCVEGRHIQSNTFMFSIGKVIAIPFAMFYGKFATRLFIILMCFVLLDHNPHGDVDGCPKEESAVPFQLKELINFTRYLNVARENFVGRAWLFNEIEEVFTNKTDRPSAVIIIGEPGAGKSAVTAQLICSRSSSAPIHDNIIGYHLCKYSDMHTLDGGKFVRNLVDMISRRMPEYAGIIDSSPWIQRELKYDRCASNPTGCFEESIIFPLEKISLKKDKIFFILIDALDECLTDTNNMAGRVITGSIVHIIRDAIPRLPKWLKWIITSRNESITLRYFQNTFVMNLRSSDSRNLQDIEMYLSAQLYKSETILRNQVSQLVSTLLSQNQGNFLFVKEMLHFLPEDHSSAKQPSLPSSIGGIYESYFRRAYGSGETFRQVGNILEILIASLVPMSVNDIYEALRVQEPTMDREYVFMRHLTSLEHFIYYDENDAVFLFHLSFAEWLTDEENIGSPFYVDKRRGNNVLADYHYFKIISERNVEGPYPLKEVFRLAQHVAFGTKNSNRARDFMSIPSERLNTTSDESGRTLLHLASSVKNTDVLRLVLPHFVNIDLPDTRGFTPAFIATMNGFKENVVFLVSHGANVNHKTPPPPKPPYESLQDPIIASKSEWWSSTLLHVASQGGHLQLVEFLLEHNASFLETNAINSTSLHIAAEYGHLEVVRALKVAGVPINQLALYLAAKNGHTPVVQYLLHNGVTDECMLCNGSFYWLEGAERYQGLGMLYIRRNHTLYPIFKKWLSKKREVLKDISNYKFLNDKHMIFCETALHTAVSNGHYEVTDTLLSQNINALQCTDYTGRSPLHESIRTRHLQIMKRLLFAKANVKFKCRVFQKLPRYADYKDMISNAYRDFKYLTPSEELLYKADTCPCGSTPLHLAARYGNVEAADELFKHGASVFVHDCEGATPLHTAACHGHHRFVEWLLKSIPSIHIDMPSGNGSTPLHSAAICGKYEELDRLLSIGANLYHVDQSGMSALHYAVLRRNKGKDNSHVDYFIPASSTFDTKYFSTSTFGMWIAGENVMYEYKLRGVIKWNSALDDQCRSVKKLVEHIGERHLNLQDNSGTSALHLAAKNGLECASGILIANGCDSYSQNKLSETPVDVAIANAETSELCDRNILETGLQGALLNNLKDHVAVVHILLARNAKTNLSCPRRNGSLLHYAIEKDRPFIVLLLLLLGADVHCKDPKGRTPLVTYLQNGGKWTDLILKHYSGVPPIRCGLPFNRSVLHLLAYRKPTLKSDNFFITSVCGSQRCHYIPGPLVEAINAHPLKFNFFSNCRDAEGYTPLHRAAQGGNLIAIKQFLSNGAKPDVLTPDKQNALYLAVQYARPGPEAQFHSDISLLLYDAMRRSKTFEMKCDPSKAYLTLYHLAAYRGLEKFLRALLTDQVSQGLDVNCPDKFGFTPLYLAKLRAGRLTSQEVPSNIWDKMVQLIESHGGKLHFPDRRAEIRFLYTHLYGDCKEPINRELLQSLNLLKSETYHYCKRYYFLPFKQEREDEWSNPFQKVIKEQESFTDNIADGVLRLKILDDFRNLGDMHLKQLEGLLEDSVKDDTIDKDIDNTFTGWKIMPEISDHQSRKKIKLIKKKWTKLGHREIRRLNYYQSYVKAFSIIVSKYKLELPSEQTETIRKFISQFEVEHLPCYRIFRYSQLLYMYLQAHFTICRTTANSVRNEDIPFAKSRAPAILLDTDADALSNLNEDTAYIVDLVSNKISEFEYLESMTHMKGSITLKPEWVRQREGLDSSIWNLREQETRKFILAFITAAQESNPNKIKWINKEVVDKARQVLEQNCQAVGRVADEYDVIY